MIQHEYLIPDAPIVQDPDGALRCTGCGIRANPADGTAGEVDCDCSRRVAVSPLASRALGCLHQYGKGDARRMSLGSLANVMHTSLSAASRAARELARGGLVSIRDTSTRGGNLPARLRRVTATAAGAYAFTHGWNGTVQSGYEIDPWAQQPGRAP